MKIQVNSQGKAYKTSNNKFLKPNSFTGNGKYLVRVIDYDGTVLKEDYLNTGDTFTMPAPPTHKGLVFQEWSAPLQITNNTVTIGIDDCIIGAVYTTASGKCEFDITLNALTGKEVTLNMDGTKEWGDGTSDTLTTHTYADYGNYTILCNGTTMSTSSTEGLFGQSSTDLNYYVTAARLAPVTAGSYAFYYCYSLQTITIPHGMTQSYSAFIYGTRSLECLIFPTGTTNIGASTARGATGLKVMVIPYGVTAASSNFRSATSLEYAVMPLTKTGGSGTYYFYTTHVKRIVNATTAIPSQFANSAVCLEEVICTKNITSVGANAFPSCYQKMVIDLSKCTAVPTLSDINAFTGINPLTQILVPKSLVNTWKGETNWSTYADNIVGV